ncbi:methyl-accepting chemotaxis protein [Leptospira sp. GIMC2001]|uniref:methyl-accepting chemotaxis protein n=1 Tax=Leptospira sp. GIMC2001 TaxID=1513297 RepID=UPI00234B098D|nr:methyl-accepting chemotaxis protein [Leptospira sp. GIMC2001]WCL49244.1 methyl-accepting chemotaxis protein [Leptospira sp. GIMC2001]
MASDKLHSKKILNQLLIMNELPLYLLSFPYFINFAIVASELEGMRLFTIGAWGTLASAIPLAIGTYIRHRKLNPILKFLNEKDSYDYKSIKKQLLNHPSWEGRLILLRWNFAILVFVTIAIPAFDLSFKEFLPLIYGCFMLSPILYLSFYYQTEIQLIPVLNRKELANTIFNISDIKLFSHAKRNLYTQIAVSLLPIMTLGYYLVAFYQKLIQLPNLAIQLPLILAMMALIIAYTSYVGSNSLNKDIENINQSIHEIGQGNLGVKVPNISTTNLNLTNQNLNKFIEKLGNFFKLVHIESSKLKEHSLTLGHDNELFVKEIQIEKDSLINIEESINSINRLSSSILDRVNIQSEKTSYLNTSLNSITSNMDDLSKEADRLVDSTSASYDFSLEGQNIVNHALAKVTELAKSNENIRMTVSIVEEISDQINLLSLNASIEAARAGEYGRGFAVVAGEVSRLADKTRENIDSIKQVVKDSQRASKESLDAMKQIQETMLSSMNDLKNISEDIQKIAKGSTKSSINVQDLKITVEELSSNANIISSNIVDQWKMSEEINSSLSDITEINSKIDESFKKMQNLSKDINGITESLDSNLRTFQA